MTRLPREGMNKTRLIPALGAAGATAFHDRLARHAIGKAASFCRLDSNVELTIWMDGGSPDEGKNWLGSGNFVIIKQVHGDLGRRMSAASEHAFSKGAHRVIIIGTDCPSLDETVLGSAFDALLTHDTVFGPATDGGYYLVGFSKPSPFLFENIPWGTGTVLQQSITATDLAHRSTFLLGTLPDVDLPEDLLAAERILSAEEKS